MMLDVELYKSNKFMSFYGVFFPLRETLESWDVWMIYKREAIVRLVMLNKMNKSKKSLRVEQNFSRWKCVLYALLWQKEFLIMRLLEKMYRYRATFKVLKNLFSFKSIFIALWQSTIVWSSILPQITTENNILDTWNHFYEPIKSAILMTSAIDLITCLLW